uniref:Uncharacterized protein n=1 Tax=Anguilla anguilla TaxID=7936 RepID=A0A0E9VYV5_ANGAN
MNKSLKTWGFL